MAAEVRLDWLKALIEVDKSIKEADECTDIASEPRVEGIVMHRLELEGRHAV